MNENRPYRLTPTEGGTRIHLRLEYRLPNRRVENAVHKAAKPFLRQLSRDIIGQVETRLEAQRHNPP